MEDAVKGAHTEQRLEVWALFVIVAFCTQLCPHSVHIFLEKHRKT